MTAFDLAVVLLAVGAAVGGFRLGFLTRVLSWVGLGAGLYAGARLLPRILDALHLSNAGARLVAAVIVVVGGGLAGQAAGLLIGSRLHAVLPFGPIRRLDRRIGAGAGAAGILVALWLLLPTLASVPGWPARDTHRSAITQWMSAHLPPPPDAFRALRRLVGQDEFPQVFESLRPGPAARPPPVTSGLSGAVATAVAASTVQVEGQACDRIQDGSGFTVAPGMVVTNAHVVAGEPAGQTAVLVPSGRRLPATVVLFDANRDLALLAVNGLGEQPLGLAAGAVGETGAVFGHPGGQRQLSVAPASITQQITATGWDLYDRNSTRRDVFVLAAALAPGDSGGPLVNAAGAVIGVAFAIAVDRPATSYALTTKELQVVLHARAGTLPAGTGGCLIG